MKLISLYIENFGGLSKYALSFEDGMTAIEAENGFGKTTLAEFIRAMFYGFPRKGKTLDKSRRQKYTPWNGGKFGGNLIFEAEGIPYRMERTFGAIPKGDSFTLIDLNTNKRSNRFTEEIGLELFGLDADAFERSTYLPQMAEVGNLSTDSIRSKLSNLVEDTNDVGNYEKAVAALKARRSTYIPYRGNGGSVMQANSRISQLQQLLQQTEGKVPELENCRNSQEEKEQQQQALETECDGIRARIRRASEAAAVAAAHRQEKALHSNLQNCKERKIELESRYPAGIPGEEECEKARQIAARLDVLKNTKVTDPEDLEAEAYLDENRNRFEKGIPSREELDDYRNHCRTYFALTAEAEGKGLSDGEKELESRLKIQFDGGLLEKDRLEELTRLNRELEGKKHRREVLELSEEDAGNLKCLEAYFEAGVPGEMTLREKEGELEQLRQLRQEQSQLVAAASQRPAAKTNPVPMIGLLLLGTGAIAASIVLLLKQVFLWGGVVLGTGVLALLGGIFAGIRLMLARELSRNQLAEQNMIRANDEKIRQLKQSISAFTVRYSTNDMPGAALYEIRDNRGDYLTLEAKRREIREKQKVLDEEIRYLETVLRRELGDGDFAEQILNRRLAREQYLDLQQQKHQAEEEASALRNRAEEELLKIRQFLDCFGTPQTGDLHTALTELERSADAYRRARIRVQNWQEAKRQQGVELTACSGELEKFYTRFALIMPDDPAACLLQIRDDRKDLEELAEQIQKTEQELAHFREENAEALAENIPENPEDPVFLREEEARLNLNIRTCTEELLQLRQHQHQLQDAVEQIPQLQDDLQRWQEQKASDQHSAAVLDATMDFLEQAKENLSNSYMGPIRRNFTEYLGKLWEDQEGQLLVTQDLDVLLERFGQARELGYFSAGQADLVMLCMRFALVDALFGEKSPCVILDDPFVNLDDAHTEQALELLKELAENRQILYLTCSSSRTPN